MSLDFDKVAGPEGLGAELTRTMVCRTIQFSCSNIYIWSLIQGYRHLTMYIHVRDGSTYPVAADLGDGMPLVHLAKPHAVLTSPLCSQQSALPETQV